MKLPICIYNGKLIPSSGPLKRARAREAVIKKAKWSLMYGKLGVDYYT